MYFHPLPRFTAVCIPLFLLLVALGAWQLQRLQWKLGLIGEINTHLHAEPLSFDRIVKLAPDEAQYRRVSLFGRFDNDREVYVYATGDNGTPVYHVIVPFRLDDGRELLVDRGIIPVRLKNPALRSQGLIFRVQHVIAIWRVPDPPGFFTPEPDLRSRVWYARDAAGIGKALGIRLATRAVAEADATPVPGGWPKGGQTVITLRNEHLQYAVTWFLMATSLVVVYFVYHRSRGRLGLKR